MEDLLNFSNLTLIEYSSAVIVTNILVAFVLSLLIAWVYQKTHRGISYSQSFVTSLVMMNVLSTIAMMILGNNLIRALGILGVFTLLRFRTIIKDTRDATYLFFALAIGMAVGTNNYTIAAIGTVMLLLINIILYKVNFGSVVREGFLLTLTINKDFEESSYKDIFSKNLLSHKLLQIKTRSEGDGEYYFSVRFKKDDVKEVFLKEIKSLPGVMFVDLVTSRDAAEY
ncbi:DUF4956 domain-containing protein [Candidatus Parcubacteria bacterium]|jgi:uncharacterized membrane protein YhiD involved in acid resistance|nr:DUF4956 domain-containing protein [Candidatus Parcubacteria bacterium]